ncbi:MAG TPA: oligogalacturonate lyase family protein [Acidobacteriaceae bacterium]|nr:oligogalacturonate lyase family protein [Acidobacteriaceae bacterium]
MRHRWSGWIVLAAVAAFAEMSPAQVKRPGSIVVEPPPRPAVKNPPKEWIDKDTGHRVFRLTDEPNSGAPYFNDNAFTPDGKQMVYTSPKGIHVLTLATRASKLLVPKPARFIVVGHETPTVYFAKTDDTTKLQTVYAADIPTGEVRKLVTLPPRASVSTVNADETLAAGTYIEGTAGEDYNQQNPPGNQQRPAAGQPKPGSTVQTEAAPNVQPLYKHEMMDRRLAARLPLVLFTINLKTGKLTTLMHSTDWINHLLFSPTDPTLLMYCHEGRQWKVDRIWTIRTDGSQNMLVHKRNMAMEITVHEFWAPDGKTIWYDWHYPYAETFFVAGYNLETHTRTAYHLERNDWSIHYNVSPDGKLFAGDGADPGQSAAAPDGEWIELFHPEPITAEGELNEPDFWQPGLFRTEHLVNMKWHDYRMEPNVRFTPDSKMVIFSSNMFGPSYVFGVEVEKAAPASAKRH